MCTGQCSRFIGLALYPLAFISILCNIILFFPGWDVKYAQDGHITEEVKYMGGLVGGGLMVLVPALYIHMTGKQGCCANRCGMFLSIAFAAVGVAGALYSFIVAVLGLQNGPLCKVLLVWTTPFKDMKESYLSDHSKWILCTSPENVVEFNVGLFATLLVTSGLQLVLCAVQMVNGLFGCLCGTCVNKGVRGKMRGRGSHKLNCNSYLPVIELATGVDVIVLFMLLSSAPVSSRFGCSSCHHLHSRGPSSTMTS
ncbi:unnamed protein product [Arctogadus glacialis]